ncbi:1,25-dihydroxyvitamin D(3) 24-hydroxylase, mitochondrial-like isoform X2 [Glandiceps talaboti]
MAAARLVNSGVLHKRLLTWRQLYTMASPRLAQTRCQSTVPKLDVENVKTTPVKSFEDMPGFKGNIFATIIRTIKVIRSGNLKRPWIFYDEQRQLFGDIYKYKIGALQTVVVNIPEDVEFVLRREGKYPRRVDMPWKDYRDLRNYKYGILTLDGADWQRNRTALSKRILRPREVLTYTTPVNDVITDLLQKVRRLRRSDNIVPGLENSLFAWALDSACSVILSKKLNLLDDKPNPQAQAFIEAVHDMFRTTVDLFVVPVSIQKKINTKAWRTHVKSWDVIFDTAKLLIDERMNEVVKISSSENMDEEEVDFLTFLVAKSKLETDEIYSNCTELLAAAVDTTSNAFLWVLDCVSKRPDVQDKLFREVSKVVPQGELPTYQHVNQMPYLKAVVKETIRLFPPAINLIRILSQDIVVQGYNIPAETAILIPIWGMSRDPRYFEDPLQFKPERWLRNEHEHFDGFRSLPFGFGPRMCIGKRLAELEMHLALARISRDFILESTTDTSPILSTVLTPDRPLNLKFIDRVMS